MRSPPSPPCASKTRSTRSTISSAIWCWRCAARVSVTLIAAALVLGGALAAGQRFRIYDAVVLKTLGATRIRLLAAYAIEYLLIGLAAVVFGVVAGSVAAELVVTRVMEFSFVWVALPAVGDRADCAFGDRRCSVLPARSPRLGASPRRS